MILPLFKCCSRFGTIKTGFWANQQSQFQKPVIIINGNNIFTDSLVYQYTSICCVKVKMWKPLSCVWLFGTPWTIQSKEFSRPEYWIAFPFCRGSSKPREWTQVSCIAGRFFTSWATVCCVEDENVSWLRIHERKYTRVSGGNSKNMPKFLEQW